MLVAEYPPDFSMKTVLIADDNAHKIELMRAMLSRFGWTQEPVIAMTSEEAIRLIDTEHISHAFIDFYIPTQNGPAIISHLKAKHPEARIALVSSSDKPSNYEEARQAGAEACLCTSYTSDEVEKAFADVLGSWLEAGS